MAALGGAVALEEVHDVAVAVAEHLDLDVPAVLDVLLDQHGVVAERRAAPPLRPPRARRRVPASRTTRMPLPPPPAAALTSTG